MPTAQQIEDLAVTLRLIEKSREHPVEMPEVETFMVWQQTEFVTKVTIEDPVLTEGTCGTAACLCGARALMDGAEVISTNHVVINGTHLQVAIDWMRWGADRFGISTEDAEHLFAFDNTMRQLRYYVQQIEEGNLPLESVSDYNLQVEGYEA